MQFQNNPYWISSVLIQAYNWLLSSEQRLSFFVNLNCSCVQSHAWMTSSAKVLSKWFQFCPLCGAIKLVTSESICLSGALRVRKGRWRYSERKYKIISEQKNSLRFFKWVRKTATLVPLMLTPAESSRQEFWDMFIQTYSSTRDDRVFESVHFISNIKYLWITKRAYDQSGQRLHSRQPIKRAVIVKVLILHGKARHV